MSKIKAYFPSTFPFFHARFLYFLYYFLFLSVSVYLFLNLSVCLSALILHLPSSASSLLSSSSFAFSFFFSIIVFPSFPSLVSCLLSCRFLSRRLHSSISSFTLPSRLLLLITSLLQSSFFLPRRPSAPSRWIHSPSDIFPQASSIAVNSFGNCTKSALSSPFKPSPSRPLAGPSLRAFPHTLTLWGALAKPLHHARKRARQNEKKEKKNSARRVLSEGNEGRADKRSVPA